jgi:hypothetical protein
LHQHPELGGEAGSVPAGIWGKAAVSTSGDAGGAAGGRTSEGENGWWVGLGGEGISRVGRAENFSGTWGSHFSAQLGSAHLRSWDRASHLGRTERLFSVEVGTAQNARTGLTNCKISVQVGICEVGRALGVGCDGFWFFHCPLRGCLVQ